MNKPSISPASRPTLNIKVNLMLLSFKEDDIYFLYSPELDLNGYGTSEEQARKSFDTVLTNFLEYGIENDTLTKELLSHGWQLSDRLVPPSFSDLIQKNPELSERMIRSRPILVTETIAIPAYT